MKPSYPDPHSRWVPLAANCPCKLSLSNSSCSFSYSPTRTRARSLEPPVTSHDATNITCRVRLTPHYGRRRCGVLIREPPPSLHLLNTGSFSADPGTCTTSRYLDELDRRDALTSHPPAFRVVVHLAFLNNCRIPTASAASWSQSGRSSPFGGRGAASIMTMDDPPVYQSCSCKFSTLSGTPRPRAPLPWPLSAPAMAGIDRIACQPHVRRRRSSLHSPILAHPQPL